MIGRTWSDITRSFEEADRRLAARVTETTEAMAGDAETVVRAFATADGTAGGAGREPRPRTPSAGRRDRRPARLAHRGDRPRPRRGRPAARGSAPEATTAAIRPVYRRSAEAIGGKADEIVRGLRRRRRPPGGTRRGNQQADHGARGRGDRTDRGQGGRHRPLLRGCRRAADGPGRARPPSSSSSGPPSSPAPSRSPTSSWRRARARRRARSPRGRPTSPTCSTRPSSASSRAPTRLGRARRPRPGDRQATQDRRRAGSPGAAEAMPAGARPGRGGEGRLSASADNIGQKLNASRRERGTPGGARQCHRRDLCGGRPAHQPAHQRGGEGDRREHPRAQPMLSSRSIEISKLLDETAKPLVERFAASGGELQKSLEDATQRATERLRTENGRAGQRARQPDGRDADGRRGRAHQPRRKRHRPDRPAGRVQHQARRADRSGGENLPASTSGCPRPPRASP